MNPILILIFLVFLGTFGCNQNNQKAIGKDLLEILLASQLNRNPITKFTQPEETNSNEIPQNEPEPIPSDLKIVSNYESKYIHLGAVIQFTALESGLDIFVGKGDENASEPISWIESNQLIMDSLGVIKVFAKTKKNNADWGGILTFTYTVVNEYPDHTNSNPGEGIINTSSLFQAWATDYRDYNPGLDVQASWQTPHNALGPVNGSSLVVLGNHGEITLIFNSGIKDGPGFDFAVFENGFFSMGGVFGELAYVEVSSDGVNFVRFDSVSLTSNPVGAFQVVQPRNIYGLAGFHTCGSPCYGTPFDLNWLRNKPDVVSGKVDLQNIQYVKIIDIPGKPNTCPFSGSGISNPNDCNNYQVLYDSFGNPIHNPFRTTGSGGFDLQGVGVIHTAQ